MADSARAVLYTDRYHFSLATLRRRVAAIAAAMWAQVPGAGEQAEDDFVAGVVPVVLGAQRQAVSLSDAYFAGYLTAELRKLVSPKGLAVATLIGSAVRGGAEPELVYRRPFGAVRHALADGVKFVDAMAAGQAVLVRSAQTDVTLSARAASNEWIAGDDRIVGWRRVAGGICCALCADAIGEYSKNEPMPIHPGCGCIAEPITANDRRSIERPAPNIEDSAGLADAVDDPNANGDVSRIVEHGELGALLYAAGDNFHT